MATAREESMTPDSPLPLIGRREHVDFPEWGLRRVRAKVDTGAYTSTLGVAGYELIESPEGLRAQVRLAPPRKTGLVREVELPVLRTTTVRNSGGGDERRPVVEATVRLGTVERRIQLTLTRRAGMRCLMLLGRRALTGAFLVDVSRKDLLRRES
jgi:hypothetical protein